MSTGPKLRFCPESNDLLYPKEDKDRRVLVFVCRNCGYQEDADPANWCVYRYASHLQQRKLMWPSYFSAISSSPALSMSPDFAWAPPLFSAKLLQPCNHCCSMVCFYVWRDYCMHYLNYGPLPSARAAGALSLILA